MGTDCINNLLIDRVGFVLASLPEPAKHNTSVFIFKSKAAMDDRFAVVGVSIANGAP